MTTNGNKPFHPKMAKKQVKKQFIIGI